MSGDSGDLLQRSFCKAARGDDKNGISFRSHSERNNVGDSIALKKQCSDGLCSVMLQ